MKRMGVLLATVFLWALILSLAAAKDPEIGRMRVAVWPEYDSTGVLFIYDGRFKNPETFPQETSFYLPPGAVISDACSLSPKGAHFCQLYTQKNIGDADEVSLKLPYPNFYLSFHTDPFGEEIAKGEGKRALRHIVKVNHDIETLEFDIQSPLRAEGFTVRTPDGFRESEKKGFTHYEKVFENVRKGQTIAIAIEYVKKDNMPSIDIKYSPMSGEKSADASPYRRQKGFKGLVYVLAAAGVLVLAVLVVVAVRSGKRKDELGG